MANANGWGDGASNNDIGWGKGADNAIGWGSVYSVSSAGLTDIIGTPAVDPDAQAFITAASITDPTQQSAINQLVVDLKGYNIWTKMKALYPFVGGTSSTHKWNLKDPRDLDVAFRLVFSGGWTHSSNGILGNGVNSEFDTKLIPSSIQSINSKHFSAYSRTNNAKGIEFGALTGGTSYPGDVLCITESSIGSNTSFYSFNEGYPNSTISTTTDSRGLFISTRTGSSAKKLYRNGTVIGTATTASSTQPNVSVKFGNLAGSYWTNKQYAFASIGDGLSDTEAANFYTAVQAFQTTLSRNV